MIDNNGRVLGRFNLIDLTIALFVGLLVPMGYATYLLFKPAQPRIDTVSPSNISREERRISAGARLVAKFKVKGTGFTPLLRARIGESDAIAFVFENPNSADVLVGPVTAGAHDLVLLDGVQEVARATGAIVVELEGESFIRAVGWLTKLDQGLLEALRPGLKFPESRPDFEIVALGPPQPARSTIRLGRAATQIPVAGLQDREAVMNLRCDASLEWNPCTMGERLVDPTAPVVLSMLGPTRPFDLLLSELLPATEPRRATIRIRVANAATPLIAPGDRDRFLDGRSAVVSAVDRASGGLVLTLTLGVDADRDGWAYRGQSLRSGEPFTLRTAAYRIDGTIDSVAVEEAAR